MRWILTTIILVTSSMVWADTPREPLEDLARAEWERSNIPGVAYAFIEGGELRSGAFGEVLAGSGERVTAETPFPLGSISKSFTALAILQLVEAEQVELDEEISAYLPVFAEGPGASITVRQLLSHTSGYSTIQGNENQSRDGDAEGHLRRHVERIAEWPLTYPPGRNWAYSNANYLILGAVIEAVTGQAYGAYIETEILSALGMTQSSVADGSTNMQMVAAHVPWFGGRRALTERGTDRLTAPTGGVIASAHDVALYLDMMVNQRDDLITAEHKALMMSPASEVASFYGLGWYVDTLNGTVSHTGLTPGVETLAMMRPSEGQAVVVLVNANGGLGFGETVRLRYAVALRALEIEFQPNAGVWGRKTLTLTFWLLPILFVMGIAVAWAKRDGLRAKTGLFGAFSVWFPLPMSLALGWLCLALIPNLFGVSVTTLACYQPDWTLGLWATASTGLVWAILRLGLYYSAARAASDDPR